MMSVVRGTGNHVSRCPGITQMISENVLVHSSDTGPTVSLAPLLIPDTIPSKSRRIGEMGGKRQSKADIPTNALGS